MDYEQKLKKIASGEIRGVRLSREAEWYAQVIATGFLFIAQLIGNSVQAPNTAESESKRSPGRPRGSRVNYPSLDTNSQETDQEQG